MKKILAVSILALMAITASAIKPKISKSISTPVMADMIPTTVTWLSRPTLKETPKDSGNQTATSIKDCTFAIC